MLAEIQVSDLGVIEYLHLNLGPSMTALTGETGAGKTLVVEALELLVGGRADASLVRHGAECAVVEGRFVVLAGELSGDETEVVVRREVPANGRSRAYIDGRMATAAALESLGASLVDLHGQHAHQSLLHIEAQRRALDSFGGLDSSEVDGARRRLHDLKTRLQALGGDARELSREIDLLSFQVREIAAAQLGEAEEEARLESEEKVLASADALRLGANSARALLDDPDPSRAGGAAGRRVVTELLGMAAAELGAHDDLRDLSERLRSALTEVSDVAGELRRRAEGYEADPERLAAVQARRRRLFELRRKYGDTLSEVMAFEEASRRRLSIIESSEARHAELVAESERARNALTEAESRLGDARRAVAADLGQAVAGHLADLAMPRGRLEVVVGAGKGDDVSWLFAANPGEPAVALEKVASGGELARVMLATRLVLSEAPPTLVFDEVDAGVGGEAALAIGRALHRLAAAGHQVLVVTHLAQVAAFADAQVVVTKTEQGGRTVAAVKPVTDEERLVELSRMLSGQPGSAKARQHAEELLQLASGRGRPL
ncbi:MAG: DNA repair protein RecN [Acidimicrobiales bacterium]